MSTTRIKHFFLTLLIWLSGTNILLVKSANCQVTPDRTLPSSSNVKLEGNTFTITGGTTTGANLFHSFQEFSIPTGNTADFQNAANVQNIIVQILRELVGTLQ